MYKLFMKEIYLNVNSVSKRLLIKEIYKTMYNLFTKGIHLKVLKKLIMSVTFVITRQLRKATYNYTCILSMMDLNMIVMYVITMQLQKRTYSYM